MSSPSPLPDAPRTRLADVTLREHGQNVSRADLARFTPALRAEIANGLARAGIRRLEVFSCTSPRRVPAMALREMRAVAAGLSLPADLHLVTLVPNPRGLETFLHLEDALAKAGVAARHGAGVFLSAVQAHNLQNLGVTIEEALGWAEAVATDCARRAIPLVAYLSAVFGFRPASGQPVIVPALDEVVRLVRRLRELGAETVTVSDLQGVATPAETRARLEALCDRLGPGARAWLGYHPHHADPAAGVALAEAAVAAGVALLDGSLGATGGCITGAPGNAPTEGLHAMLERLGARTGVDRQALAAVSRRFEIEVLRPAATR